MITMNVGDMKSVRWDKHDDWQLNACFLMWFGNVQVTWPRYAR